MDKRKIKRELLIILEECMESKGVAVMSVRSDLLEKWVDRIEKLVVETSKK